RRTCSLTTVPGATPAAARSARVDRPAQRAPRVGLVRAVRPGAHAALQLAPEPRVVAGDALERRADRARDVHARALGVRAGLAAIAPAEADGAPELARHELELGPRLVRACDGAA